MATRVSSPLLVDRERETGELVKVLGRAGVGDPRIALVRGEAGIGKTRLVTALEDIAARRGMLVLHGACVHLDGAELPYAPLAGALREAPDDVLGAALSQLPPRARGELARTFPQLASGDRSPSPSTV